MDYAASGALCIYKWKLRPNGGSWIHASAGVEVYLSWFQILNL